MKAIVVFSTRFGTTEKVARSLESGLRDSGVETHCFNAVEVPPHSLASYDLICVGSPTEAFSASVQMKQFLKSIQGLDLSGKLGFAFDTKINSRLSGSAAKYIEGAFKGSGARMVAPRESAIVSTSRGSSGISGASLKDGEEERFRTIGKRIGQVALASCPLPMKNS